MLEVVFSDSVAAVMAMAFERQENGIPAKIGANGLEGTAAQGGMEGFCHETDEPEHSGWENAIPLEGSREDIINLPLALSVGDISESGIGAGRKAALSLLMEVFPSLAAEVVEQLLDTARKSYALLLERAGKGEAIRIWVGHAPDDVCGLCWLMSELEPMGLDKLDVTLMELPRWETREDGCVVQYTGWGEVEPYRLGGMALLGKKPPVGYLGGLASRWKELQRENAPLRAVMNGRLVSVPEPLYDTVILRELENQPDEFVGVQLVGRVLGKYGLGISDSWVALRMEQFIKEGLLVSLTEPEVDAPIYHRMLRKVKR